VDSEDRTSSRPEDDEPQTPEQVADALLDRFEENARHAWTLMLTVIELVGDHPELRSYMRARYPLSPVSRAERRS
jgi:hypothetical protein